jgi:hypothetical protein
MSLNRVMLIRSLSQDQNLATPQQRFVVRVDFAPHWAIEEAKNGKEMNRSLRDLTDCGSQVENETRSQVPDSLKRTVKVLQAVADLSAVREKNRPSAGRQDVKPDRGDCVTAKRRPRATECSGRTRNASSPTGPLQDWPDLQRGHARARGAVLHAMGERRLLPEIAAHDQSMRPGRNIGERLRKSATGDR